jgi:hypothetical protein
VTRIFFENDVKTSVARRLLWSFAMQWTRLSVWVLVASVAIFGVAFVADALVQSDEEYVGELADALVGPRADRRIDALLAWVDPTRAPLTVRADGHTDHFGETDEDPSTLIHDALAPFDAESIEVVQRSVRVEGDRARVALRVRSEGEIVDAQIALRRDGQSWLVDEIRLLD